MPRLLEDYSFQKEVEAKCIVHLQQSGLCVMAAGCGAGKTDMTISIIQKLLLSKPKLRILVLTHGQTYLRRQFVRRVVEVKARGGLWLDFTYEQITGTPKKLGKSSVLVGLPHAFASLPDGTIDMVVVDEAHHFYFSDMIRSILYRYQPKYQLLLTGSPSKFIAAGDFPIVSVSSGELLACNIIANPYVELCQTTADYTLSDFTESYGLKGSVKMSSKAISKTARDLVAQIGSNIKGKTFIACRYQKQARVVAEVLNGMGIKSVVSSMDYDKDSSNFDAFTEDPSIRVLVVVARGVLGFNMPTLTTVVDFTFSYNPDRIFQLMARGGRRSAADQKKTFIKVVPTSMLATYLLAMNFTVGLSNKEVYESYDGNFREARIPILDSDEYEKLLALKAEDSEKRKADKLKDDLLKGKEGDLLDKPGGEPPKADKTGEARNKEIPKLVFRLPRIDNFLNLPHDPRSIYHRFASTTLIETLRRMGEIRGGKGYWTKARCEEDAKRFHTRGDWGKLSESAYQAALRHAETDPEWFERVTAHMVRKRSGKLSSEECFAEARKYKYKTDFRKGSPAHARALWNMKDGSYKEATAHMDTIKPKGKPKPTEAEATAVAKKFTQRVVFQREAPEHYAVSRKGDRHNENCAHMTGKTEKWPRDLVERLVILSGSWTVFRRDHAEASKKAYAAKWVAELKALL